MGEPANNQSLRLAAKGRIAVSNIVGSYMIFPSTRVNGQPTLNGIRSIYLLIRDRFELTLEGIRRWYFEGESPLQDDIERCREFFSPFGEFQVYCHFSLLEDLVCEETGHGLFWLPFEDFSISSPLPQSLEEYLAYREKISEFSRARNLRIRALMCSE